MAGKYIQASITPPRRVQIVKTDDMGPHPYWKPGQFGHAVSYSTHPGMYTESGPSKGDALSYLVSKSKDGHTGATWFSAEALRFTGKAKAPSQSHARKKKLDPHEAKRLLESEGVDFTRDYHADVSMSKAARIAEVARQAGYRKSKNAPGSTARMYFQYLSRLRGHATRRADKHTVYDLLEVNTRTKNERVLHEHFSTRADAKEAQDEYKAKKKPGVTYRIKPRQASVPASRWNPED
jgi:hypothetical protein